jgi:transcriptional regulator with XRE-family HTH domain
MFAYIAMVRPPPEDDPGRDHHLLGAALRRLRVQAGLTQRELGERAQIGVSYLSQLENGHRGVGWHSVTRLLAGIGADLHQLADAIAEVEKQQQA